MTYGLTIFQFFSIQFLDKIVNRPYQNLRYRCGDFKTTLLQGWGRGKKNYMNYEASTNINFWSKTAKTEIWFFCSFETFLYLPSPYIVISLFDFQMNQSKIIFLVSSFSLLSEIKNTWKKIALSYFALLLQKECITATGKWDVISIPCP